MKFKIILVLLSAFVPLFLFAQTTLTIGGYEKSYNQIRVVNNTSQEKFRCRISVIHKNGSQDVFGIFYLSEKNDTDSNTNSNRIKRGEQIVIEMPKDFPVKTSFSLEYKDFPLWDVILIHIYDETSQFEGDEF